MAKTIFYLLAALVRKIVFCHSKIKFAPPYNILYIFLFLVGGGGGGWGLEVGEGFHVRFISGSPAKAKRK